MTVEQRSGEDRGLFRPVSIAKFSEIIVDQVKAQIREGLLVPGDRLPSERDLCQRFGVSRVTMREALRVLEAIGLVSVRVGHRGGAFVTTPSPERLGEGFADILTLSAITGGNAAEARMLVEVGGLALIVERATAADIADLTRQVHEGRQALKEDAYDRSISTAFHLRLAECAHNPALTMLIHSLRSSILLSLREEGRGPSAGRRGLDEHAQLVAAIQRRDLPAAQDILVAHLERSARRVAAYEDRAERAVP